MNEKALVFFVLVLISVGLLTMASLEFLEEYASPVEKQNLFLSHVGKVVIAFLFFLLFLYLDHRLLFKKRVIAVGYVLSVVMLVLLFFDLPFVERDLGARRWFNLGYFSFQPSEFVKVYLIIFLSWYIDKHQSEMKKFFTGFLKPLLLVSPILFLILLEPNLSTFLLLLFTTLFVLYAGETRGSYVLGFLAVLVFLGILGFKTGLVNHLLEGYQIERLRMFLSGDVSEQVSKALEGIKNGGILGKGIMLGESKLIVPVITTDFVLAAVGEELGYIGLAIVLFSFYGLVHTLVKLSAKMYNDLVVRNFIAGFAILIMLQVMVNVGVVAGLIPVTGMPLPFVSHGGSSMAVSMAGLGIIGNMVLEKGTERW